MRIKRTNGLPDYFNIESNKKYLDNMIIEFPNSKGIIEISYDSAEYSGKFSLKQIVEIRNALNEILNMSGYE